MDREAVDAAMLRTLSMNSRYSIKKLAARLGEKTSTTYDRVRAIERAHGIRYILEIRPEALGYYPYVATVKFNGTHPTSSQIKDAFEEDAHMQLAAMSKGGFGMFCYFLAKDNGDAVKYLQDLRAIGSLKEHDAEWSATPYYSAYGFVPIRGRFFDMLESKVWQRTKETPRPENNQITRKEYEVLRAMNSNAAIDFAELDSKLRLEKGMSHYIYNRLMEKGVIKRPTLTIGNLPVKYSTFYSMKVTKGSAFEETREQLLGHIIGNGHPMTNRYSFAGNTLNPLGTIYVAPRLRSDCPELEDELRAIRGTELSSAVITEVPVGMFCHRLFDNVHSSQYQMLVEQYKKTRVPNAVDYGC